MAQSPIGAVLASPAVCAAWSCSRGSNSFGSFRSWSGRASTDEIRLLKAACKAIHDYACRDRADALLKKKLEANNPYN